MSDEIRKFISLDRIVGQEIPADLVDKLRVASRVQFPLKNTTANGISTAEDLPTRDQIVTEHKLEDYVDHVRGMETLVKQLEDLYDDLTKNTRIPPASDAIAEAAKALNSDGSPDITRDTIDTAEAILNALPLMRLGYDPFLLAATGDGTIDGPFLNCDEVTHSMVNAWNVSANSDTPYNSTDNNNPPFDSVEKSKNDFDKKMKQMVKYLFNMLWWNLIWGRTVSFTLGTTEKLIAKPIDAPILIFKWKKPTVDNLEKYGPVHKLLNRWKIALLCRIPKKAWSPYKPEEGLYVIDTRKTSSTKGKSILLTAFCKSSESEDCPDGYIPPDDALNMADNVNSTKDAKTSFNKIFPDGLDGCFDASFWGKIFKDMEPEGPDTPPECAQHAITILEAVARDSLSYADYTNTPADAASFTGATTGNLGSLT